LSPPNLSESAAHHVRHAISEIRGSKTAIGKGRSWLPRCDADIELLIEVRRLREIEVRLIALARKLETSERLPITEGASP
jgi:hypothetical protein